MLEYFNVLSLYSLGCCGWFDVRVLWWKDRDGVGEFVRLWGERVLEGKLFDVTRMELRVSTVVEWLVG